jgi:hypothetical protein
VTQAVNDKETLATYLKARNKAQDKAQEAAVAKLVEKLREQPLPPDEACGPWEKLRARIKAVFVQEFYGKTAAQIQHEVAEVNRKFEAAKTAVASVVPSVPSIKYSGIGIVDQAIWAANQAIKLIRAGFGTLGGALKGLGEALADPFSTAKENLSDEIGKVGYKRAVTWVILESYASDTVDLFDKFGWFFFLLALWLVFSYALWVHRRLVVGWALLCDRPVA